MKSIVLKDNENVQRKEMAKMFLNKLKNISSEKEFSKLIIELNKNGFDLYNRSNSWSSRSYSWEEYDDESLYFTYGCYPISGRTATVKFANLYKRFYIKEV